MCLVKKKKNRRKDKEEWRSKATKCREAVPRRARQKKKYSQKKRSCVWLCVLTQPVKVMSSPFFLGGVPGLASCQPSGEPNDSFDPIRISAKSTLCSLRACARQLTTRPPSMMTLCANQPCPVSAKAHLSSLDEHSSTQRNVFFCWVSADSTDLELYSFTLCSESFMMERLV